MLYHIAWDETLQAFVGVPDLVSSLLLGKEIDAAISIMPKGGAQEFAHCPVEQGDEIALAIFIVAVGPFLRPEFLHG